MSFLSRRTSFGLITRALLAAFMGVVSITAIGLIAAGFVLSNQGGVLLVASGITVLLMILAVWAWFPGKVLWP